MSAEQKATILDAVVSSTLSKRQVLKDLGVPKSTYYPVADARATVPRA